MEGPFAESGEVLTRRRPGAGGHPGYERQTAERTRPPKFSPSCADHTGRAVVMISGVAIARGLRSQSPYCASTANRASATNDDTVAASRKRNVLRLAIGARHAGLL